MKAIECKWFTCVYAMKDSCSIDGWMDVGTSELCPYYKRDCIRVNCKNCARQSQKDVCPLDEDDNC